MEKSGLLTSAKKACELFGIFIKQVASDPVGSQKTLLTFAKSMNELHEEVVKGEKLIEQFQQLTGDLANMTPEPTDKPSELNKGNPLSQLYKLANSPEKLTEALTDQYFTDLQKKDEDDGGESSST